MASQMHIKEATQSLPFSEISKVLIFNVLKVCFEWFQASLLLLLIVYNLPELPEYQPCDDAKVEF